MAARADYAFEQLKKDDFLTGLNWQEFIEKLTFHATEIWEVHPFREGNTRTVVEFIRLLCNDAGHKMTSALTKEPRKLSDAFVLSTSGESVLLNQLFKQAIAKEQATEFRGERKLRLIKRNDRP